MTQGLRQACVLSPLPFNIFAAVLILLVALQRFRVDADILAKLVPLQERPTRIGPEIAQPCVYRRRVPRIAAVARLRANDDDSCRYRAFGQTASENKTETKCVPNPYTPVTSTTLRDDITAGPPNSSSWRGLSLESPNLSLKADRRIRAVWVSFNHYRRELYDRPKASLPGLTTRMVKSEVVKAFSPV